jgi:hypothetical protein
MIKAVFQDGWVRIVYKGEDRDRVEISVDGIWKPAYRHWDDDQNRIIQVRPPESAQGKIVEVLYKANGAVINAGKIRIL